MVIMLYMFAIYALFVARCMHVTEALCVHKLYMTSSRMFVVSMWHVCFFPLRYISGSLLTAVNCSILLHNIADECFMYSRLQEVILAIILQVYACAV